MTQLEEFQHLHGEAFSRLLSDPAFSAGMIHLTVATMNRLRYLSDEEIQQNSVTILADLRGRLRHEADLISLAVPPEPVGKGELQEEYPDSVDELFVEQQRNRPTPNP